MSELTLGGIVKHMARGEQVWTQILVKGDGERPDGMLDTGQYRKAEGERLPGFLRRRAAADRRGGRRGPDGVGVQRLYSDPGPGTTGRTTRPGQG
ncbi:hypothetical protein [Streptomyces sp. NBC_00046]|uniref:hypothetical protein n=1 Tax=unclassified Streptomyces TaxID=2593676 RepID=UPI003866E926